MRILKLAAVLCLSVFAAGCPHHVELTIKNVASQPLAPTISTKDSKGLAGQTLSLGSVQPNQSITKKFDVDDGGSFSVSASIPSSATVFEEPSHTVTSGDPNPLQATVDMKVALGRWWDPAGVQQLLTNLFTQLGPDVGFTPLPVDAALDTVFGGLYVIGPEAQGSPQKFQLNVGSFSSKVTHLGYPSTSTQSSADVSRDVEVKVSASAPVYGKLATYTGASQIYKFNFDMHGYGMVPKVEADGFNYQTALNNLTPEIKSQLCRALNGDPGNTLLYVNKMYVLESATFDYQDSEQIKAGIDADAGSIVTASGAYTYSTNKRDHQSYQNSVINLGGVTWKAGELPICPGAAGDAHPSGELLLKPKMGLAMHLAGELKDKANTP